MTKLSGFTIKVYLFMETHNLKMSLNIFTTYFFRWEANKIIESYKGRIYLGNTGEKDNSHTELNF